jgi:hypothetical protein
VSVRKMETSNASGPRFGSRSREEKKVETQDYKNLKVKTSVTKRSVS